MGGDPRGSLIPGPRLVLASASPRRHQLLRSIGLDVEVAPADIDETELPGEHPRAYVERVALAKARAVHQRLGLGARGRTSDGDDESRPGGDGVGVVVLAADTTVDLDGAIMAKPVDDADARRMLRALSGRTHQVHTAVSARSSTGVHTAVVTTDVTFGDVDDGRIDWYLGLGEHGDKAGAYGMQGAGGAFVTGIAGSPSNVIGLPLAETVDVLAACGFAVAGVALDHGPGGHRRA